MNPHKNFVIGKSFKELGDVMYYLYNNPSIYFKPLNRVMPSKFFMNWAWMSNGKILSHIICGNFSPVKKRETLMRERIREILSSCPNDFNQKKALKINSQSLLVTLPNLTVSN